MEDVTCPYGNKETEAHPCPFELNMPDGDKEFRCLCCKECQENCAKEALY